MPAWEKKLVPKVGVAEAARIAGLNTSHVPNWGSANEETRKKSIAQSQKYWQGRLWRLGQETVMHHLTRNFAAGSRVLVNANIALESMSTMYDIAYMQSPTASKVQMFHQAATKLRSALAGLWFGFSLNLIFLSFCVTNTKKNCGHRNLGPMARLLDAPVTVWSHIWTVHMPQYLEHWGTLWPFLCHGVEGRHRIFKQDLRCSTGTQWKAGQVGFAQTLVLDNIRWGLIQRGLPEYPRYQAGRSEAELDAYREYEEALKEQVLTFHVHDINQNLQNHSQGSDGTALLGS